MEEKNPKNEKIKRKMPLKRQLYFWYFTAILIPVLVLGTILFVSTFTSRLRHSEELLRSYNSGVRQTVYDVTTYINNVSESIVYNDDIEEFLAQRFDSRVQFVSAYNKLKIIDQYMAKYNGIGNILIYTENVFDTGYGVFVKPDETIKNTEWFKKAKNQFSPFWTSCEYKDSYGNNVTELALVRRMTFVESGEEAVVMVRVSNSYLNSRLVNRGYVTFLSANKDDPFYGNTAYDGSLISDLNFDYEKVHYTDYGRTRFNDVKALYYIESLKPSQSSYSQLYITSLDVQAFSDIYHMLAINLIVLLIAAVLPLMIITLHTSLFTREVKTLRNEMHKASLREEQQRLLEGEGSKLFTSVELSDAYDDLLVMVKNIEDMEAAQYEAEIKEKKIQNDQQKMEFKMLASQINPHFLYNTLEMIRMKALTGGDKDVANAIKLLGQSMRYVLENTGTAETTLQREMDHIDNYLKIQKLRFGDRIDYQINIMPEMVLSEYAVLPLLLQPIVENAIVHGIEKRDSGGKVWIAIYIEDNNVKVDISDNGGGMDEETMNMVLHRVKHYEKERHSSGIALYNINRRIKLNYGEEYGLELTTEYGEGTRVRLVLPVKRNFE